MVELQDVSPHDEAFLFEVYASTRRDELMMTGWGREEQDVFLRMQYELQKQSYALTHNDAIHKLLLLDGVRVGRLMTAETEDALLLIDISLLEAYRGQGIGTELLRGLQKKAAEHDKVLRLHVLQNNPAARWYERLGFRKTGDSFPYSALEWKQT